MANFKLSKNSKKNLRGVREGIKVLVKRVLEKSEQDFGIPRYGGLRTPQEQNNLFHQRPKVTNIDGFKRKSYHQTGNAFDIFAYHEHDGKKKACWECKEIYEYLANLFKEEFELMKQEQYSLELDNCWFEEDENIYWGGDWIRFKDLPHFEIR